jgi:hypothetical protein
VPPPAVGTGAPFAKPEDATQRRDSGARGVTDPGFGHGGSARCTTTRPLPGKGIGGTLKKPQGGVGGTAGGGSTWRMLPPPLPRSRLPCDEGPPVSQDRAGSRAHGGVSAFRCSA